MENFDKLKESQKLGILTKEKIFSASKQLEILFHHYYRLSWKKRYNLCRNLATSDLFSEWINELKLWGESENIKKRVFVAKILCFFEEKTTINNEENSRDLIKTILEIIKNFITDSSIEVTLWASRALGAIALKNRKAMDYWKELLKSRDPECEKFALGAMGELLNSEDEELKNFIEYFKIYFNEPDRDKAINNIRETLKLTTSAPSVFLLSLDAFLVFYPELAEKIILRDYPLKSCAVNILKSFFFSVTYLYNTTKTKDFKKLQIIYDGFSSINQTYLTHLWPLLKFSTDLLDYELYRAYIDVCMEFAHFGIQKAYNDLTGLLSLEIPLCFKVETLLAVKKLKVPWQDSLNFSIDISNLLNKEDLLIKFISIAARVDSQREKYDLNEAYGIIVELNDIVTGLILKMEDFQDYNSIYLSIIRPLNIIMNKGYIYEIVDLIKNCPSSEMESLACKTVDLLINNYNKWISLLQNSITQEREHIQRGSLIILLSHIKDKEKRFDLIKPVLKSEELPLISISEQIIREIINRNNKPDKVIEKIRIMSYFNASEKLFEAILHNLQNRKFNKLIKSYSDFYKIKDNPEGIFLKNIVFMEELPKDNSFRKLCQVLFRALKCKSIKEIHIDLENKDFKIQNLQVIEDSLFTETFRSYMETLKKNIKEFIESDFKDIIQYKLQIKRLKKGRDNISSILNLLHEKGFYLIEKPLLKACKKVFNNWETIIENTIEQLEDLQKEINSEAILPVNNIYKEILKDKSLDENQIKKLEQFLQVYLIDLTLKKNNNEDKIAILTFLNDLYMKSPDTEKEKLFHHSINYFPDLWDESSTKIISTIISEHFIRLIKNKKFQEIIDNIYFILENTASYELIRQVEFDLAKKNAPEPLKSLIQSFADILNKNAGIEQINRLIYKIKDFNVKYPVQLNFLETYECFLEIAKNSGSFYSIYKTLLKLKDRGKLIHSIYNCFKDKMVMGEDNPEELICLKIIQNFYDLINEMRYFLDCDFEKFEDRIGHLIHINKYLENLGNLIENHITEPVAKIIIFNLFIRKLLTGKEEEPDPESSFSMNKLLDRWQNLERLVKLNKTEEIICRFYSRKDICNYLQLFNEKREKGETFKEFRDFIIKCNYNNYEFDRALYVRYIDHTHNEHKGFFQSPPSPYETYSLKKTGNIFNIIIIMIALMFFFLPPLIGAFSIYTSGIILRYLFLFFITVFSAGSVLYLFLYKGRGDIINSGFILPDMFNSLLIGSVPILGGGLFWKFGINIKDGTFIIFSGIIFILSFLYINYHINSGIIKSLTILFIGWIEAFIISFTGSTLFSNIYMNFIKKQENFLFNSLPGEYTLWDMADMTIYPSLIYTWSFLILFIGIIIYSMRGKKI